MRKFLDASVVFDAKKCTRIEWLNARKSGIGGSDAASVLGLNPFKSSVSVYRDKVDYTNEDIIDAYTTYKMELGNKLEDFVANEFTLKTGKKVRNVNGILHNEKYPFAIANIDRAIVSERAFLECKVTSSYSKKEWMKGVPIYYQIQCYHYMAVTGATHCYVAVLIGNEELVIHRLDRDEEVIGKIMALEDKFWRECIIERNLPAPDGSSDYSDLLQEFYKDSKSEELILFEKNDFLERYDDVARLIKELDIEKKAIEQYLQSQMKEYEIAYLGERKISWKRQSRSIVDTKRLKKEHPDLVENYLKTTTSRVFRM